MVVGGSSPTKVLLSTQAIVPLVIWTESDRDNGWKNRQEGVMASYTFVLFYRIH